MTSPMTGAQRAEGLFPDDNTPMDAVPNVSWSMEVGKTGLRRASGYVDEEFLPALRGRKGVQVFREMGDNDPIAGSLLFSLERLIAEVSWAVEPASDRPEDRQNAEYLEQCRDDMTQTWGEFIMEAASMLQFGWSWHEMCFKRRLGPWYSNEKNNDLHRSKFDDGKIGWAKFPIRSQESLLRWAFHDSGDVLAMVQMPAPFYDTRTVPYKKSLLFRPKAPKGNPEGFSILRRAYRPWYMKKRIEEDEAIGVQRDLAGLPYGKVPSALLGARPNTPDMVKLDAWKKLVQAVRRDERDGVLWPSDLDPDTKGPLYEFGLLNSGGSRQFDTNAIIERYAQWMLMQALADFILVGHQDGGSYSLHTDKSGLFKTAGNSFVQAIAAELNRKAVPLLFKVNGVKPRELPRFSPGQVDSPDLEQLGAFMTAMGGLGIQWFPDPKVEAFVRDIADLPELDADQEAMIEQQARQQRILASANQRLQALQIGQQAAAGEMELQQQQGANTQQALQTAGQAAELAKPGSTQPPQKALPAGQGGARKPPGKKAAGGPAKKAAGRKVSASKTPSRGGR